MEQQTGGLDPESARLLRSRQNAHSPVFKLPEDILLKIFLGIRDSAYHQLKGWLKITQICSHWREIALSSPSLWATLNNPPHGIIPLMLERSQAAPLRITLLQTPPTAILTIILQNIERIETLDMAKIGRHSLNDIDSILSGFGRDWEAASLESLSVGLSSSDTRNSSRNKLAVDVFRPTRRLQRLSLSGVSGYSWNMLPMPNLTELLLYGVSVSEIPGALFVEVLRQMPKLQSLGINWQSLRLRHFPPTPPPLPINLPNLTKLEILYGNKAHVEPFLSMLRHPHLRQMSVDSGALTATELGAYTSSVASSVARGNFGPLEFLRLEFGYVTISAKPWVFLLCGPYLRMLLSAHGDRTSFRFVAAILNAFTQLNRPDVVALRDVYLGDFNGPSPDEFVSSLAPFVNLETIEVHQSLALVLIDALKRSELPGATWTASNIPIPFAKLRSIIWRGEHQHRYTNTDFPTTVFDDLYNALLARRAQNVPIHKLELAGCGRLNDSQERQLRELGIDLVVQSRRW